LRTSLRFPNSSLARAISKIIKRVSQ